jgi:hypothetical protein
MRKIMRGRRKQAADAAKNGGAVDQVDQPLRKVRSPNPRVRECELIHAEPAARAQTRTLLAFMASLLTSWRAYPNLARLIWLLLALLLQGAIGAMSWSGDLNYFVSGHVSHHCEGDRPSPS